MVIFNSILYSMINQIRKRSHQTLVTTVSLLTLTIVLSVEDMVEESNSISKHKNDEFAGYVVCANLWVETTRDQ